MSQKNNLKALDGDQKDGDDGMTGEFFDVDKYNAYYYGIIEPKRSHAKTSSVYRVHWTTPSENKKGGHSYIQSI